MYRPLLDEVEQVLQHEFSDKRLLLQALTHSSFSNERNHPRNSEEPPQDNERLEFLGDAVIGLVVARELMERFPTASEGLLSRWRSTLVSRKMLSEMAMEFGMGEYLLLGRGELRTGGTEKRSILAAALEALVGAVYLDGGLDKAGYFLNEVYASRYEALSNEDHVIRKLDQKTALQERTQSVLRATPRYRLVDTWGAEHNKMFRVEIEISGRVVSRGDGRSKKEAEQEAAGAALEVLGF